MKTFLEHELTIPEDIGTVRIFEGQGNEGIVLIREAHVHYEAQRKWAQILIHLIENYGWDLVCVEGGSRNDSVAHLRKDYSKEARRQKGDEWLHSGEMAGEEYVDFVYDYSLLIYGVEDPELYNRNVEASNSLEINAAEPIAALRLAVNLLTRGLERACGSEVVRPLLPSEGAARTGLASSLVDDLNALYDQAALGGIRCTDSDYPNLLALLSVVDLERTIDFQQADQQNRQMLAAVASECSGTETDQLLQRIQHAINENSPHRIWHYLWDFIEPNGSLRGRFPQGAAFCRYSTCYAEIDLEKLLEEKEQLTKAILDQTVRETGNERLHEVAECLDAATVLLKMFGLRASHQDSVSYLGFETDDRYDTGSPNGIRALVHEARRFAETGGPALEQLDLALARRQLAADFYDLQRQRANAMLENVRRRRREFKRNVAMFVAGGFHTAVIKQQLKEVFNEPHAIISPKITSEEEGYEEKYRRILRQTYTPMRTAVDPPPKDS